MKRYPGLHGRYAEYLTCFIPYGSSPCHICGHVSSRPLRTGIGPSLSSTFPIISIDQEVVRFHFGDRIVGKSMKMDYRDQSSDEGEDEARPRLQAVRRHLSVASVVFNFLPTPLRVQSTLSAGSAGFFRYCHVVYSPEFFAGASGTKLTCKLFRQITELMGIKDHKFVGSSASLPFALYSYPFHIRISPPSWGAAYKGVLSHLRVLKNPVFTVHTPTLCNCEHEHK